MRLFNLSVKALEEVYKSIDTLPQWNWIKIHETGNLGFIKVKSSYRGIKDEATPELEKEWEKIYDEYIDEFGLTESYTEMMDERKKIAILKNQYVTTEKRVLLNHIRIAEKRLEESLEEKEKNGGVDFRESIVLIEKQQGIKIDAKKITVADYNSYIKIINKNGKAN